ncbi:MAG: glutaminase, partial [Xanthomonadales bacterium]|nr:glutaminase [Xanthomonadales bacterium]
MTENHQALLDRIAVEVSPLIGQGAVASYIPALARVPAQQFGMALRGVDGLEAAVGQADTPFSIQSM